jgi:CPA2 family monovalent cation:H+ antiporter-2
VVAESEYHTQVIAEVLPLRDLFAALFFVSVGMLLNPIVIASSLELLGLLTLIVVAGKALITIAVVMWLRVNSRAALLVGLSLAQVGEFSFVLARIGVSEGILSQELFDLTLATAVISIILTPSLLRAAPVLIRVAERVPFLHPDRNNPDAATPEAGAHLTGHVVICGYGRVGRQLADELAVRGEPYIVVEYNAALVRAAKAQGVNIVFGDAGNPVVLDHVSVGQARLLAVLVPDSHHAELATRNARAVNASLDIIARASRGEDVGRLWHAGATEVVQPEFEAGLEVIRHTLSRYGVEGDTIELQLQTRREVFYRSELA